MIDAHFSFGDNGSPQGFVISGHSGWADPGSDIVCASVSSAVMLVCNTLTDFFGEDVGAVAEYNRIELTLRSGAVLSEYAAKLINSLITHLKFISEDYPGTVRVTEDRLR